jgi:hypothetical protein
VVRGDFADYLWGVQRFDREVGRVLAKLEAMGELDNTIVVISGDNGMPFPRCKATLYDQGTRVPLTIRWGGNARAGRVVTDFVSLCDLAPTFLEIAGLKPSEQMTGRSLMPILSSTKQGRVDASRDFAMSGMERHVYLYPSRSLRTDDFLFIRNFEPESWPTGVETGQDPVFDFAAEPWPTIKGAFSYNIDPSPTKQYLRLNRDSPRVKPFAALAFIRHPEEELYDLRSDPDQLVNVAERSEYAEARRRLRQRIDAELIKSGDPRVAAPGYTDREIRGWPIRVSDELMRDQKENTEKTLELLDGHLQRVSEALPIEALAHLKNVPIWLSPTYPDKRPTAEYHPSGGWLRGQGRRPELERCVELTNIAIFEKETVRMPLLLLHELAHAYHHQVLGFDHPDVLAAFERAEASGGYELVERHNGKKERAYALSNHKEYFAEASEAFFGTNDWFPFTRDELKKHDPQMDALLEKLWR